MILITSTDTKIWIFTSPVFDLKKSSSPSLLLLIPVLIQEVTKLTGLSLPISDPCVKSNVGGVFEFFLHTLKICEQGVKTFSLAPLSGFKT